MADLSLERFIYTVKKELLEAQERHEGEPAYFSLDKVELEVNVTTKLEGDGTINVAVAQLGSRLSKEKTHVAWLSFSIVDQSAPAKEPGDRRPKKKVRKFGRKYARR
jgi:Trypsin-co-occurring domain 2